MPLLPFLLKHYLFIVFAGNNKRYAFSLVLLFFYATTLQAETEPYNSGWQLNLDNNVFQRYMKDRDYTAGIAFTATGSRAQSGWLNIDMLRAAVFDQLSFYKTNPTARKHSVQYGFTMFTPDDITATQPVLDDRPFASLFYISNTELVLQADRGRALRSSLTLGLLGLDLAGDIQKVLHRATGSDDARGWANQISSGGEPTAMLSLSVQHKLYSYQHQQISTCTWKGERHFPLRFSTAPRLQDLRIRPIRQGKFGWGYIFPARLGKLY